MYINIIMEIIVSKHLLYLSFHLTWMFYIAKHDVEMILYKALVLHFVQNNPQTLEEKILQTRLSKMSYSHSCISQEITFNAFYYYSFSSILTRPTRNFLPLFYILFFLWTTFECCYSRPVRHLKL